MLKLKLLLALLFATFLINNSAFAQTNNKQGFANKIDYKCWVELYGGEDIIQFISMPEQSSASIAKQLTGKKVIVPFTKQKQKIFRVFECVKSTQAFRSDTGRKLDKQTLR